VSVGLALLALATTAALGLAVWILRALWRYDRDWAADPPRAGHVCGPDCGDIYDGDAMERLHAELDRWERGDT